MDDLRYRRMGRGAMAKIRWKNDRIKKKKERDKRRGRADASSSETGAGTPGAASAG